MKRKTHISYAIVAICIVVTVAILWFGLMPPRTPSGWDQVHAGMDRKDVLLLLGPATHSGWPEKVVETWEARRVIFDRRLSIAYRGDGTETGSVDELSEGLWLNGYGWVHPRTETTRLK